MNAHSNTSVQQKIIHSKNKGKKDVSFLHENMIFHDATCKLANKQEQLAKFQPFLKTSIF